MEVSDCRYRGKLIGWLVHKYGEGVKYYRHPEGVPAGTHFSTDGTWWGLCE